MVMVMMVMTMLRIAVAVGYDNDASDSVNHEVHVLGIALGSPVASDGVDGCVVLCCCLTGWDPEKSTNSGPSRRGESSSG